LPTANTEAVQRPVTLTGRWTRLRPLRPDDDTWLYTLACDGDSGTRWRLKGWTPSPEVFRHELWRGVLCQFVAAPRTDQAGRDDPDPAPFGLVTIYQPNLTVGHAYVASLLAESARQAGWTIEAIMLAVDHAFATWNLRKLYFDVPAYNLTSFASALDRGFLVEEARLCEDDFHAGSFHDRHILSLQRGTWEAQVRRLHLPGRPGPTAGQPQ
jgi:RimJ/RimL family protein N-acetyltransferase